MLSMIFRIFVLAGLLPLGLSAHALTTDSLASPTCSPAATDSEGSGTDEEEEPDCDE